MSYPMNSSSADDARNAVAEIVAISTWNIADARAWRRRKVSEIQMHAVSIGLNATIEMVDRHFEWFLRWHRKSLSTGHLMKRTGVRKRA